MRHPESAHGHPTTTRSNPTKETPMNTRTPRTAALIIAALLLLSTAFASRPMDIFYIPAFHVPVTSTADQADPNLVLAVDFSSANDDAIATYAKSLGLAVD